MSVLLRSSWELAQIGAGKGAAWKIEKECNKLQDTKMLHIKLWQLDPWTTLKAQKKGKQSQI